MNERIKELAEQAGFHVAPYDGINDNDMIKKFAELIVQECVNVLHDTEPRSRHISHALKQHFGVEE